MRARAEADQLLQLVLPVQEFGRREVLQVRRERGERRLMVMRRYDVLEVGGPQSDTEHDLECGEFAPAQPLRPAVHPARREPPRAVGQVVFGDHSDDASPAEHGGSGHRGPRGAVR
jgi:hypothetical protein